MAVDIGKIIAQATGLVSKINEVLPQHWKGNAEHQQHHFDKGSIHPVASLDIPGQKASLTFGYTDNGDTHTVGAILPFQAIGGTLTAQVQVDGAPKVDGHVEIGPVVGIGPDIEGGSTVWYDRIKVVFHYRDTAGGTVHEIRFDGDLP